MKSSLIKIAIGAVFALAMIGCSGASNSNSSENTSSPTNASNTATKSAEPSRETKAAENANSAGTSTSKTATSSSGGDKIGVEACDEYLTKYEACIKEKVPAANRSQLESSLSQTRSSWRSIAASPQGKVGLTAACTAALNSAKTQMASYNCTW